MKKNTEGEAPPERAPSESTLTTTARLMGKLLTVPKREADKIHRKHQD